MRARATQRPQAPTYEVVVWAGEGDEETLGLAKVAFPMAERQGSDVGPTVRLARGKQPHPHHASFKEALREPDVEIEELCDGSIWGR